MKKLNATGKKVVILMVLSLVIGVAIGIFTTSVTFHDNETASELVHTKDVKKIDTLQKSLKTSLSVNYYDSIQLLNGGKTPTVEQLNTTATKKAFTKNNKGVTVSDLNEWIKLMQQ